MKEATYKGHRVYDLPLGNVQNKQVQRLREVELLAQGPHPEKPSQNSKIGHEGPSPVLYSSYVTPKKTGDPGEWGRGVKTK